MAKLETSIDVKGLDAFKTMIELLNKYRDQLPDELVDSLCELADTHHCEFGCLEYQDMANGAPVETDFHTDVISSVNKVLKRVRCYEDGVFVDYYPEHFRLGANGNVFIQW